MRTTKKPKKKLVDGELYSVQCFYPNGGEWWTELRWTRRGWKDIDGNAPVTNPAHRVIPLGIKDAPTEWQVVLLREYARKLERAGDQMAKWFPFSSLQRKRMVGEWTEVRRVKP